MELNNRYLIKRKSILKGKKDDFSIDEVKLVEISPTGDYYKFEYPPFIKDAGYGYIWMKSEEIYVIEKLIS